MNDLLLDDYPLIILPSLAEKVGLNESIILQQLHYWLQKSNNERDGFKWVYNTYDDWAAQFPFWSVSTIRRTVTKLENANLIIIGNYNKLKIDNTKWYRLNYPLLQGMSRPPVQNEQTTCSNWTDDLFKMNRPLPETTTETTSETTEKIYIPFREIIDYLNEKTSSKYKHTTRATKDLIKARFNQGFDLDDFKKVIDNKTAEWLNDPNMSKYLRPETLFGTKFESYLNQKGGGQSERNQLLNKYNFDKKRELKF